METGLRRKDALEGLSEFRFVSPISSQETLDVIDENLMNCRRSLVTEGSNHFVAVFADDVIILVKVAMDNPS